MPLVLSMTSAPNKKVAASSTVKAAEITAMIFDPNERVPAAVRIKTQVSANPGFANQRMCHFPIPAVIQPQMRIAQAGIPSHVRSRGLQKLTNGRQAKKAAMLSISVIRDKRLVFMLPSHYGVTVSLLRAMGGGYGNGRLRG